MWTRAASSLCNEKVPAINQIRLSPAWPARKSWIGPCPGVSPMLIFAVSSSLMMGKYSGNRANCAPCLTASLTRSAAWERFASRLSVETIWIVAALNITPVYVNQG